MSSSTAKKSSLTIHVVAAGTLALTLLCYGVALAVELDILTPIVVPPGLNYFLLPNNDFAKRVIFLVFDSMETFSTAYALLFVVVLGETLQSIHARCMDSFMQFASVEFCPCRQGKVTAKFIPEYKPEDQPCMKCSSFLANLKLRLLQIQQCFDDFGKVGGVYALAIVFQSTLITIRAVGVIAKITDKRAFNQTSFMQVQYVASILVLLLLANFGTHLQSKAC